MARPRLDEPRQHAADRALAELDTAITLLASIKASGVVLCQLGAVMGHVERAADLLGRSQPHTEGR